MPRGGSPDEKEKKTVEVRKTFAKEKEDLGISPKYQRQLSRRGEVPITLFLLGAMKGGNRVRRDTVRGAGKALGRFWTERDWRI